MSWAVIVKSRYDFISNSQVILFETFGQACDYVFEDEDIKDKELYEEKGEFFIESKYISYVIFNVSCS